MTGYMIWHRPIAMQPVLLQSSNAEETSREFVISHRLTFHLSAERIAFVALHHSSHLQLLK